MLMVEGTWIDRQIRDEVVPTENLVSINGRRTYALEIGPSLGRAVP